MRNMKQVQRGLETLAERGLRKVGSAYRRDFVRRILGAIHGPKGAEATLRALGPGLVDSIDETAYAEQVAAIDLQCAGIGMATATPKVM